MIRKITPANRAEYISMAHDFYNSPAVLEPVPDEYYERTFEELMRSDVYAEAYILEQDGTTAGYALLAKTFSQEAGGLCVWIEELYLKPEFRNAGLGGDFLEYVKRAVPAARYRLETEPENERAAALYRRHGFRGLGYISYYLENSPE